jgi:hypothetical protein
MNQNPDRRNPLRLIVTKETQLRILRLVCGGVFCSLALAALASVWVGHWVWRIALGLVIGSFASLWVSRRIAGPFYRIEKDLEAFLTGVGQEPRIQLREGDPLWHLGELINKLEERVRR